VDATTGPNTTSSASISDRICGEADCGPQLETGAEDDRFWSKNLGPEKTKRHGEIRAPFAFVRPGRSVVVVAPFARPTSPAGCFATLSSRDSGLFAREFVRGSFLVGGAPTFRRDCALRLRIHCRESAGSLATHTACIACLRSALSSRPADRSTASASYSAAANASVFHPVPFVVCLVCHYRSPAAIFEFVSRGRRTSIQQAVDCPGADRV